MFFFASRRRHTRCALVTGVQTCSSDLDAGGQDRPHVRRTIEDPAMRCHPAAVALLLLAGCASTPKPEPMPTLVKVPVVEYVRVPDSLTKPCPVTRVASRTDRKSTRLNSSH